MAWWKRKKKRSQQGSPEDGDSRHRQDGGQDGGCSSSAEVHDDQVRARTSSAISRTQVHVPNACRRTKTSRPPKRVRASFETEGCTVVERLVHCS